jgi:membrane associated rhomboid family serine protease
MSYGNPADPTGSQVMPHCYRHPDRETYISCQRCGRPICPDCMRSASVGFQCPECVKEARSTQRQPRTAYGAMIRNPGIVTNVLIGLNVAVFVLIHATGGQPSRSGIGSNWLQRFWLLPWQPPGSPYDSVAGGSYWQLVTAMFTHVAVLHILLNMVSLWVVGTQLEYLLGRWRYLAVYLASGFAGNVLVYLVSAQQSPSLGASGAIFGIFGCLIVLAMRLGANVSQMLVVLGLNLVFTFQFPNISWEAHIGGLAAGLALGAGISLVPARARSWAYPAMFVGVVAVGIAVTVIRTASLPPA